ncbi:N-formylglutamate amidohydrolase [Algibacter sp.]|uniref:N-formylglutamate amidohydrolase n=1 Tax=Algibacter sp. TaxID=1872428 RepID=UPI003C70BF77
MKLIITCEHGGNKIPQAYANYFDGCHSNLNSHRGYDLGALDVYKTLVPLADYSLFSETSRLLIELNRSTHHNNLFSEFSKKLSKAEKISLINSYYLDYRNQVENKINEWLLNDETVLHLSIHSFTPILNNKERLCDIGLLYDSKNTLEKTFCASLKKEIKSNNPLLNVRYNYPYLGTADGFTTYLRKQFHKNYMGIEIEMNQKYVQDNVFSKRLKQDLSHSISTILNTQ